MPMMAVQFGEPVAKMSARRSEVMSDKAMVAIVKSPVCQPVAAKISMA
jgi:hypothetical protein